MALLHASGCTSNGHEAALLYGDDIEHRAAFFLIDTTSSAEVLEFHRADVGAGRPPEVRAALIDDAIANAGPRARAAFAAMCEVAQRFAGWLDLGARVQAPLEYVFARWDRRGFPDARGDEIPLAGDAVDAAFLAFAALTGLKSPWLREHSTAVAELAESAAWRLGLPPASVTLVRRAALGTDLGRVGVSNAIWEKPGPLGFGEWERVRLHPHFTERAFAQSRELAVIGVLAGSHHERLDGSGYHRGTRGPELDQGARILAAADCYCAVREPRPYRLALDAGAAETELLRESSCTRHREFALFRSRFGGRTLVAHRHRLAAPRSQRRKT